VDSLSRFERTFSNISFTKFLGRRSHLPHRPLQSCGLCARCSIRVCRVVCSQDLLTAVSCETGARSCCCPGVAGVPYRCAVTCLCQ
jgi:hypothetical protein